YGARAAPTGHGSRLPHAEGKIVTKGDKSKADILTDLGVPVQKHNKYNNVEFEKDTFFYDALLGIALMLGENLIEGADYFYVSKVEVKRSRNALFTTSRGSFDETFSTVGGASTLETNIKNDFEALTSPKADTGWLDHTNLSTTNRGDGQMAAMNGWNALGAAAAANKWYGKAYPLNQNWEWLHIQGAQIGGKTQGDNLVAGLYVTNSAMIPYENTIKDWAQPNKRGLGGSLEARFEATPVGGNTKAFASQIKLSIAANNHSVLGTIARGSALTATFDPLTGRVVDNLFHQIKFKKDNWKH
ncbi:MAG: hypothetical protein MUF87_22345, partial [Anaerolineae bacterium]|nr:hypothetical protein [Anaerolineae bacterium]